MSYGQITKLMLNSNVGCIVCDSGGWKCIKECKRECPDRDKRLLTSLLQIHIKKIDIPGTVSVISQKMAPMYKPGWNPKNFGYCPDTQR